MPRIPSRSLLVLSLILAACDRAPEGPLGGTIIVGTAGDADALIPSLAGSIQGRVVGELLFDRLVEMGPDLNVNGDGGFIGRLAHRWSWSADSLTITFTLNPAARWHDGYPVRSQDVLAGYAVIKEPANGSSLASHFGNIDSVSVSDSLTVHVHFAKRSAEQFYASSQIFPLPAHLVASVAPGELNRSDFGRAPIGSGRYRLVMWEAKSRLELAAVEAHYRGRARLDRVVFTYTPEAATGLARVWAAESDLWEPLTPNDVAEASRRAHVRVMSGPGYDYGFLAFNFRDAKDNARPHALFTDRALRRALTMAVDRDALRRAMFDSLAMPSFGPFTRPQNTSDTTIAQIPFDRAAAALKLDSLGWTTVGSDGIRTRGAQRLSFGILVPTSSAVRMRASVLLQEQLRLVGVEVLVDAMEFGAMREQWQAGRFDATIGGWRTTPSPSGIRGTWGSPAISRGARQNVGSYANAEFDAAVETGLGAIDPADRRTHMRRAYQIIVDDAPAIWLYEVRNAAAIHKRFNIPRWRSDAWWTTLSDWSVDPEQRLPRDARPATP